MDVTEAFAGETIAVGQMMTEKSIPRAFIGAGMRLWRWSEPSLT